MGERRFTPVQIGVICVLIASTLFSVKGIFIKMAYGQGVEPITVMTWRMIFSLPFFLAAPLYQYFKSVGKDKDSPLALHDWMAVAGLGFLGFYLASVFDLVGLQYVSAGIERLILYTYPAFVILISGILFRQKMPRGLIPCMLVAYGGIAMAFMGDFHMSIDSAGLFGAFLIVLSSLAYAFFLVINGRIVNRIGHARLTAYAMTASSGAVFVHFVATQPMNALDVPSTVLWVMLGVALFSTVIPAYLMGYGLKLVGSGRAAVISNIGPISTFVLAWMVLGEKPGWMQVMGMVLVIVACVPLARAKV